MLGLVGSGLRDWCWCVAIVGGNVLVCLPPGLFRRLQPSRRKQLGGVEDVAGGECVIYQKLVMKQKNYALCCL